MSKTYHIEDTRLENIAKLQFNKNSAMISCLSFLDLNFILDILYLEKVQEKYSIISTYEEDAFIVVLNKKENK